MPIPAKEGVEVVVVGVAEGGVDFAVGGFGAGAIYRWVNDCLCCY